MTWLAVGLLFALASCSSSTDSASNSPKPAAPAACRLPFVLFGGPQAGSYTGPGFINYPAGTFTPDPSGSPRGGPDGSTAKTYDKKFSRWDPAPFDLVSSDGARYTYTEDIPNPSSQGLGALPLGTKVHLVDVATGKDDIVYQTRDALFAIALKPEGVYLGQITQVIDTAQPYYLWLLNPTTRSAHELLGGKPVNPGAQVVGDAVLWTTDIDPNNPVGRGNSFNEVLSVNLADGTKTTWFEQPTMSVQLLGLDSSNKPVISIWDLGSDPGQTLVVSAPNVTSQLAKQQFTQMVTDSRGLWLGTPGVVLVRPDRSIHKIFAQTGALLGPCE